MKKYLFFATALIALASCSSNDYIGEQPPVSSQSESGAIKFGTGLSAVTRADHVGADAANLLNKNFVVEGIKTVNSEVKEVFDNYNVNWVENTADKTLSNTANWEYVGQSVLGGGKTQVVDQSIKYWDYSASQYDFWAYSLGGGSATVSSMDHNAALNSSAYTFTGSASDLSKVYISDLVTAYNNPVVSDQPAFQNQINLSFRSLVAKVRIGLYETIPGYSVKSVKFYPSESGTAADAAILYASSEVLPSSGVCTVYFKTIGRSNVSNSDYNKAHISFADAGAKTANQSYGAGLAYGAKLAHEKTPGNIWLANSSAAPTWATSATAGDYTIVLPNEGGTVLTLKVDYTLESTDGSGEEIKVTGAKALIPSQYTQWKSNYAYTYLFKISDNINGKTGGTTGPEGLYPITFDAVVIDSEEHTQETITTVATPSITTYSVSSNVTTNNEYKTSDVVYVTTTENGTLLNMTDKAKLYTVSKAGATEAEVLDALNTYVSKTGSPNFTYEGRNGITLTPVAGGVDLTITEIPLIDGNKITDLTEGTAGKLTFASAGTYAFVYTKTAADDPQEKYQEKSFSVGDSVDGYYTFDGDDYSEVPSGTHADAETKYYERYIEDNGVYGIKVIKVVE